MIPKSVIISCLTIGGFIGGVYFFRIIFGGSNLEPNVFAVLSIVFGAIIATMILIASGKLKEFTIKGASLEFSGKLENSISEQLRTIINSEKFSFDERNEKHISIETEQKINSLIETSQTIIGATGTPLKFNEELSMAKAGFYYNTKNYQKAVENLTLILENDPRNISALYGMGKTLCHMEKFEDALTHFNLALGIKKDITMLFGKIVAFLGLKKYNDAMEICELILQKESKNIQALWYKGVTLEGMGKPKDAIKIYNDILEINPNDKMVLRRKGIVLNDSLGEHENAVKCFDKIEEIDPNDIENLIIKSHTNYHMGREKEALSSIEKVLEIQPDNAHALYHKAQSLARLGKYEEAILIFNLVLKFDSSYGSIPLEKGDALTQLGQYDNAVKSYDEYLTKHAMDGKVMYRKAVVYMLKGDKKTALSLFETVFLMKPELKDHAKHDTILKNFIKDEDFAKILN